MPELKKGEETVWVPDEWVPQYQDEGWAPVDPDALINVSGAAATGTVRAGDLASTGAAGATVDPRALVSEREYREFEEEVHGGTLDTIKSAGLGVARGLTLGGSDALARAFGADPELLEAYREINPYASFGGEIIGAIAPALLTGGASAGVSAARVGTAIGRAGAAALRYSPAALATRAASAFARGRGLGATVVRGAAEGALFGAGEGVTQVALSDKPVTAERIASAISSNMLYGGVAGASGGLAGKALEAGLGKAARALRARQGKLDDALDGLPDSGDDLAGLDAAGLRAARDVEIQRIKTERLARGEQLAADLAEYRDALKQVKNMYPLTKGAPKGSTLAEAGGRARGAVRQLRSVLDTPADLAARPSQARKALAKLDQTYKDLAGEAPKIRAAVEAEGRTGGARAAALDALDDLQTRNTRLQAEVADLTTPLREVRTPRLDEIAAAKDALAAAPKGEGFGEKIVKGGAFGAAMGGLSAIGVPAVAALPAAGLVADKVGDLVFRRAGKAVGEASERLAKAVEQIVSVTTKATPAAPVLASKVLTSLRYSDTEPDEAERSSEMATAFAKRAAEIRQRTTRTPEGLRMTRQARRELTERLLPVAALDPLLADQLESVAARRLEFLATRIPRSPGLGGATGPDTWEPSDFEIRAFARYAAAVEDPIGVLERAADGTMTTEDAEALREVYPEIYGAVQQEIRLRMSELRDQLPYSRRLMLSILFNVPLDPGLEPNILAILQGHFAQEDISAGGTSAPMPEPSFGKLGSVAKPEFTPAQERGAG